MNDELEKMKLIMRMLNLFVSLITWSYEELDREHKHAHTGTMHQGTHETIEINFSSMTEEGAYAVSSWKDTGTASSDWSVLDGNGQQIPRLDCMRYFLAKRSPDVSTVRILLLVQSNRMQKLKIARMCYGL